MCKLGALYYVYRGFFCSSTSTCGVSSVELPLLSLCLAVSVPRAQTVEAFPRVPWTVVVVVIDLPLLRVAVEGSDNPVSLEKPCQASLPPDQQGRHSLRRHPEVRYVA